MEQPWPEAGYDPAAQPSQASKLSPLTQFISTEHFQALQVLLSVLASSVQLAMRSWRDYSDGLALPRLMPTSRVSAPFLLLAVVVFLAAH